MSKDQAHIVLKAKLKCAPFKCSVCKKVFISGYHLQSHKERRHQSKDEWLASGTNEEETMKAVLNATERIEDLLVKLALKEETKSCSFPSVRSSPKVFVSNDPVFKSISTETREMTIESSCKVLNDNNVYGNEVLPQLQYNEFLDQKDNEALCNIATIGVASTCLESVHDLIPKLNIISESHLNETLDAINSFEDCSSDDASFQLPHSRLKCDVIRKLNQRLESYGLDSNQNTLSDKEMLRINQLLKDERNQIAERTPEYYQLRNLIKDNAERRIERNLNKGIEIT